MTYDEAEQIDLFESSFEKPSLPSHIRLIEFFAGIGAQAKALEMLGADFEHWRTCEWSWQSITAYNAIHMGGKIEDTSGMTYNEVIERIKGVSNDYNKPMTEKQLRARGEKWARELLGRMIANRNLFPDVSRLHAKDLGITDRESNTYILTYSFPCQDLSNAGLLKGMEKGSGTRSGLLWEVERILNECRDMGCLPQVLVMENVPGVCSSSNEKPWGEWLDALHRMGYTNYSKILNAKDYGIPQNRRRCFMVSILGDGPDFVFPDPIPLEKKLKDCLEENVDESYFLSEKLITCFSDMKNRNGMIRGLRFKPRGLEDEYAFTLQTTCCTRNTDNYIIVPVSEIAAKGCENDGKPMQNPGDSVILPEATKAGFTIAHDGDGVYVNRVQWKRGVVQRGMIPTLKTTCADVAAVVHDPNELISLRKLTPRECWRLMGWKDEDIDKVIDKGISKTQLYKMAGNSIVIGCLTKLFQSIDEYNCTHNS